MAQKRVVELIDDLDGTAADQTVQFALDGSSYEVDLSDANATDLRSLLERFTANARRTGGRKRSADLGPAGPSTKDVRAWALAQGMDVNLRGRVPESIVQQYLAAT
ncbi:Lsr2 family protein [Arthrobacter sp. ISL-28]|uniref:histone-like nucleoid-structuring protein Lsr2 n=1 Tax=Arthrobacter sp. ISL-28 TaxID=2819108 RepID=UPI001BEA5486|nr:Lsr2 family protein [Arthrobacter sp. ISL-28]MBT2520904.1 Lsr2 family protein [Arthrobacter sp. ISL-28]